MGLMSNLLSLYQVDAQVRGLRNRLDSAERYRTAQTRQVQELSLEREELLVHKRQVQANIGNLESENSGLDERLEKLRTVLNGASTNKQYTAVLTELNTVKVSRSECDDRILKEMEKIEAIEDQAQKIKGQHAERSQVLELAERELKQRHEDVGQRLAELEAERELVSSTVPAAELKVFNEMGDTYDGEAMAPIEELSRRRREYACGLCNMHIPFESVAALLSANDSLSLCPACGRILYLQEETRGALAKK